MDRLTRRQALQRGGTAALTLSGLSVSQAVAADQKSSGNRGPGTNRQIASMAEDAYLYGLQQALFYEIRFNYTQKQDSDVFVGVNRWYRPNGGQPITADFTAVVSPNATTLYQHAFLDLQDEPVVIEMPEVTVYNRDQYLEENEYDAYSVNDVTAERNDDGSVTIHFGGDPDQPNFLYTPAGWSYTVRLYQPREPLVNGSYQFPEAQPVE